MKNNTMCSLEIKMPNSITIGDPMYFELLKGKVVDDGIYQMNCQNNSEWIGCFNIIEKDGFFDVDILFAPNKELLKIYKEGNIMDLQYLKTREIGVDTSCYDIWFDQKLISIPTKSGFHCKVSEIYNEFNVLEGLKIYITKCKKSYLKRLKEDLEYFLDIKLTQTINLSFPSNINIFNEKFSFLTNDGLNNYKYNLI